MQSCGIFCVFLVCVVVCHSCCFVGRLLERSCVEERVLVEAVKWLCGHRALLRLTTIVFCPVLYRCASNSAHWRQRCSAPGRRPPSSGPLPSQSRTGPTSLGVDWCQWPNATGTMRLRECLQEGNNKRQCCFISRRRTSTTHSSARLRELETNTSCLCRPSAGLLPS